MQTYRTSKNKYAECKHIEHNNELFQFFITSKAVKSIYSIERIFLSFISRLLHLRR